MNSTRPDTRYSNFIIALILIFPIAINSVKVVSSLILLIFTILGVYIIIVDKKNPFKIKELKLFSWLTVSYFGAILLSGLMAEGLNYEFHHLGRKLQFLLAPLIALTMFKIDFSLKNLLLSLKIGLIIIGTITMAQYQFQIGEEWFRPAGMMNQNIFGDIAVAMLFLSIVQVLSETPKEKVITFVATLFGVVAIVLSASRGSWVSFIILSIVFILINRKSIFKINKIRLLTFLSVTIVLLGIIGGYSNIKDKASEAITDVQEWVNGSQNNTSQGLRLQMWSAGLSAAKQAPWFGYGYRNANKVVSEYAANNKITMNSKTHLHNEYITNLVSAGIVGLVALLSLLFIPITIFYQRLKDKENFHYASMGLLLCASYATFGFTHIAFGEEHVNSFYVFFIGLLLPKVIDNINKT